VEVKTDGEVQLEVEVDLALKAGRRLKWKWNWSGGEVVPEVEVTAERMGG
jgi:hypothetical protein